MTEKSTLLPAAEIMLHRLESANLIGFSNQTKFLTAFADSIGGRQCNGSEIAAAWDLLMLTKTKHYMDKTVVRLEGLFDMIIDITVSDPEVAASAKAGTMSSKLRSMMRNGSNSCQFLPI
jgi:hypothetical protein